MKAKTVANSLKNAVSTVFLLAGAFFVCSTFLSMRAVFADPIAPVIDPTLVGPNAPEIMHALLAVPAHATDRRPVAKLLQERLLQIRHVIRQHNHVVLRHATQRKTHAQTRLHHAILHKQHNHVTLFPVRIQL